VLGDGWVRAVPPKAPGPPATSSNGASNANSTGVLPRPSEKMLITGSVIGRSKTNRLVPLTKPESPMMSLVIAEPSLRVWPR